MKDILQRVHSRSLSSAFIFLPVFPLVSLQACARSEVTRWRWSLQTVGRSWRFRGRSSSGWTRPGSVKLKTWPISRASMRPLSYTTYERDTIQDSYMWVLPFSQNCSPRVCLAIIQSWHMPATVPCHHMSVCGHVCMGFLWVSEKDSVTHTDTHACVCSSQAHSSNFCSGFMLNAAKKVQTHMHRCTHAHTIARALIQNASVKRVTWAQCLLHPTWNSNQI